MLGYIPIGLAVAVSGVPAALTQDSRVLEHCKSAGTGTEAEKRQTQQTPGSNTAVSVEVPIGKVCVGPELLDDEPIYVRRTTVGNGITVVEVSATPFMPVLGANEIPPGVYKLKVRPDQPAGW